MARRAFDPSLYLVTDWRLPPGRSLTDLAAAAVRGGTTLVQLRDKRGDVRTLIEEGRALKALLAPLGVPLLVNDRVDVALAVGADGVHLGQSDMPAAAARRILGPDALIGLSLEHMSELAAAESLDVDYYGASPVFPTPTKTDTGPGWGLAGLTALRAATRRPIVAIGGIGPGNAAEVARAGADGLAVVSALCAAPDPAAAARGLLAAFRRGRAGTSSRT